MLLTTPKESMQSALKYIMKLPLSKIMLRKLSEHARGKCIVYFSLHRILEDEPLSFHHPHFMNKTALTLKQARSILHRINEQLPFISLSDSLEYLKGHRPLNQSHATLLIEVPYVKTIQLLLPLLEELRIPTTFILSTESIYDGQMPWMDEIIYRLGSTNKKAISVNFIDRAFSLTTGIERIAAAHHLIDHIRHANQNTVKTRLKQLRESLSEVAVFPTSERICTVAQLEKIALNPLFSFACAGKYRLPFFDISLEDAKAEMINAKNELSALFNRSFMPVFFHSFDTEKKHKDMIKMMMDNGIEAAISKNLGVCRPGDNMFRLMRLPLSQETKSFQQFELQGLSDAIDEFLLITLAKEQGL